MELVGEQKRIQALFSELKFADEQTVPRFATVWNRAAARTARPARAFNLSFVAATALLVGALVSLALWSKYSQRTPPQNAVVATVSTKPPTVPSPAKEAAVISPPEQEPKHRPSLSRARRLAAQRHALVLAENRKAAQDAAAISTWQSPTSALLKSQNDELLKSIPQLNENSDELKSFLPNKPR